MNYLMTVACEVAAGGGGGDTFPASLFTGGRVGIWHDRSDFGYMYQDLARTSPVTAVGQTVAVIVDKSGNDFDFEQSDNTKRMTIEQDADGKYYLDGDLSDYYQFLGSVYGTSFNGVIALGFRPAATSDGVIFANRVSDANTINPQLDINAGFYRFALRDNAGTLVIATSTTAPDTARNQILMGLHQAGVTKIFVDGVEEDSDSTALGAVDSVASTEMGAVFGATVANGRFYTLLGVAGVVTADEQANIQNYVAEAAGRVLNAEVMAIYSDTGATGDFWDLAAPSLVTVNGSDEATAVLGGRGSINFDTDTQGPLYDEATGWARFYANGAERTFGVTATFANLGDAFYVAAVGKYVDGFFRIVCVNNVSPHDVLFDIRIGEASAENPDGISALVQDAQANIANIAGISVPATDELFVVTMKRTAGGNAVLKVNGVTGNVIKGAATAGDPANTRFSEDYAATGHDFYLGRSLFMAGALPSAEQEAAIEAWLAEPYE